MRVQPSSEASLQDQLESQLPLSVLEERLRIVESSVRESAWPLTDALATSNMSPPADDASDCADTGRAVPSGSEGNSGLMHYMSTKYGTPIEHLHNLSSSGTFKTVSFDSSSCGRGPIIRCPPEANLSLPTPTHLMSLSPTLFPLNTTDSCKTTHDIRCLRGEREVTKSVCECADGGGSTLSLKFESSFEGGNLQQAIKR